MSEYRDFPGDMLHLQVFNQNEFRIYKLQAILFTNSSQINPIIWYEEFSLRSYVLPEIMFAQEVKLHTSFTY